MATLVTADLTCRLTGEKTHRRALGDDGLIDVDAVGGSAVADLTASLACPRYDTRYLPFERADTLAVQPRSPYCVRRF